MEETAGNAVLEVGKCLSAPIGRQIMYLYNYNTNFHNLKKEAGKLKDARDEVKAKVVAAENNVEKIKQNVKDWQGDVDSTIEETDKLIQEKSNSSCFNLITCYKNGRKAWKKLNAVTELLQEKETFAEVSLPITHEVIRLTNKDYEEFESRRSIFNDVLKSLDDPEAGIIGVYGMGGIGKTTLVKEVGHQAKKNQILDEVVFVEVSDKPDAKKIQDELAYQLGVKFDTEAERASKLYARLKNDKKVLVILDNIWEQLDLEALGIPCGDDRGGCILLLTARDLNVLWSMDSKNNFSMGVLKEEEAWSLFKKMAGNVVDQTNKLNSLPNAVCKECHGLPIVITTIARALRYKRHQSEWKDALRDLKKPSPTKFAGLPEKEYAKIALSYNYLKRDELKKTLLICSLMVNNTTILDLFKLIMSLNILEGANFTMEEARNKLESLVYELKYSCLLLDGSTSERFSMHDVVRSVVITIAYKDHHIFTERNDMRMEWSDKEQLKKCTKISLADCNMISEIWSQGLDYPKLEFFSMRMEGFFEIHEDFFVGMGNLKVLSFFHLDVLSLPTSLGLLTNLQTLCLDCGTFSDITIIGELRELKILSLRCCEIKQLPEEISKLTQLRSLDLSYCQKLEVIVPNVISSLSQLEELYMSGCFISWKLGILEELKHLSQLTTLEIDISNYQILPKDFFPKKLERYEISIGNGATFFGGSYIHDDDYRKYMDVKSCMLNKPAALRTLKVNLNSIIWQEELQCFSNVEFLCLDKLQGIKNDLYELDEKGFSQLKYLHVHNNPNILCIVDSTKCIPHDVFALLESLIIFNLINLEKICYGLPSTKSFYNLKFIEVKNCDKLKNIFSFSNASRSLPQLQLIKVEDCKNLIEIFAIESKNRADKNEVIDKIEFCQLRFLTLIKLPRIASFYPNTNTVSTSQKTQNELTINLESSDINSEDEEIDPVIPFFNKKVVFPCLEELNLGAINSERIWDNKLPTISCCYQNLKRLIVDGCQKQKFVFPPSIIESFKQLQHLEIHRSKELKEIVAKEEIEGTITFIFPRLAFLKLEKLPKLTTLYHGKYNSNWPMLKELEVRDCSRLDIFTSEYKVVVPSLEVLKLCSVNCEILWDSQLVAISSCYQNLKSLILNGCGKLQYVFLSSMVKSFERLEHIQICNCSVLKEIISKGVEANKTFVFSRVTFLKLENLPELATFYPGVHTSEWPVLKKLEVCNCNKIKTFTSEDISFLDNNEGQHDIWAKHSLFLVDKIPNLEKLTLSSVDDMIKLLHQFPENFCRCTIEIKQDKSTNISVGILQRSVKLEKLILSDCSNEEIFTCGEDEKHTKILIHVKSLELCSLSDAKYLWGKGSKLDSLLQNLEVLEVNYCNRMINVLPSSASFENLTVLNVWSCYGLMNLLTPAIAKNLVQLREMKIEFCRMMTEIVSNKTEDVAAEDEIVFGNLKLLSLRCLQNLICFYFGNYALKFPALEELTVDSCPMMMTFSVGNLDTPSLQKVQEDQRDKDKWSWNGNLNATIQQLYEKENIQSSGRIQSKLQRNLWNKALLFVVCEALLLLKFPVLSFWFQVFCSRIDCGSPASLVPCIVLSFQNQPLQLLTCCACHGITAAVGFLCRI
ncbi:probable disease resistance protein At4g27220 isoform X2 [Mangifera indica]|uniref:probable disease resistance protein At4g27220 isoform X2 n=1 Tax=Mangifera indica TaxID=29780 RepID=UPI001CFB7EA3|nr:probable disease resistance protein At4g27220 isoform X2 [Mangifera indica]